MNDYSTGSTLQTAFVPNKNPTDAAKSAMIFAGRRLSADKIIIPPQSNTPMPSLYSPFKLGAYTNGSQALVALSKMGFKYVLGIGFNASFIQPNTITVNIVTGLTTISWNDPLMGVQDLIGTSPIGSAIQGTATGSIVSAYIKNNVSFLVVASITGSSLFTTSAPIIITAELANPSPDPKQSDEVCVLAYAYFNQYSASATFVSSPELWLSVYVTGVDTSISPTGTPFDLTVPTSATVQPDISVDLTTSVNLTYPIGAANLGRLPTVYLGNILVTQAGTVPASGIFNGYTLTATQCIINVVNVTGVFDTTATNKVTVILDITQNGGVLTGDTEINSYGMGYNCPDLNTLTTMHGDFYDLIVGLQSPKTSKTNKFEVQGYYGYIPVFLNAIPLAKLITPNVTYFKATAKLDISTTLQSPCTAGILMAASMFNDVNNQDPYNASSGKQALLNVTASSNQSTIPVQMQLNQLATQGWTAIAINVTGQCYIYRNQCTLQSISGLEDNEYRFEELQQKSRWLGRNAILIAEATCILPNGMRQNNNPGLISSLNANMLNILAVGFTKGMLGKSNNSVVITQASATVLRIAISTSIVSANSGNEIFITIKSFNITTG